MDMYNNVRKADNIDTAKLLAKGWKLCDKDGKALSKKNPAKKAAKKTKK